MASSRRPLTSLGFVALVLAACGGDSTEAPPVSDVAVVTVDVATSMVAGPAGWTEIDINNPPAPYAGRWWEVSGCCLSGYGATEGSPPFASGDSLDDGRYVAVLVGFDPTQPASMSLLVSRLEDCANMPSLEECAGTTTAGQRFEPTADGARKIEVPLDDNLLVTVFSHAENPSTGTGVQLRTMSGNGFDLRDLLRALYDDYTGIVQPLVDDGADDIAISQALARMDGPFAVTMNEGQGFGMARWSRPGFPPLSYWQGTNETPGVLAPVTYDPTADEYVPATFEQFIRRGGALEIADGVISFSYGWMASGG